MLAAADHGFLFHAPANDQGRVPAVPGCRRLRRPARAADRQALSRDPIGRQTGGMRHTRGHASVASDGLTIFHQAWLPDGDPKAVVLLFHGLGEHSGRYAHVAGRCSERRIRGARPRPSRPRPIRRQARRTSRPTTSSSATSRSSARSSKPQHPGLPLVVLGHSMGGNLARRARARPSTRVCAGWH